MGRERTIIRWDVHRQMLLEEVQRLEQALRASEGKEPSDGSAHEHLLDLQARLRTLGPSPHAKMG
jgi:hypothetical protein